MTTRRFLTLCATGALAASISGTAFAQGMPPLPPMPAQMPAMPPMGSYDGAWSGVWTAPDRYEGTWEGSYEGDVHAPRPPAYDDSRYQEDRERWLAECRRRYGDNGLGGALIGGLIGGVAGNRIAGKGHRTVGTIAGAAVGAIAGAAIDKGEDSKRVRDECEAYLDSYSGGQGYGYPAHYPAAPGGYAYPGYGYPGAGMSYGYPGGCGCRAAAPMPAPIPAMPCGYGLVMMVPTWVPVPPHYGKRVREEVYYDTVYEVETKTVAVPDKRVKYIKSAPAPTKYTKTAPAPTKYVK